MARFLKTWCQDFSKRADLNRFVSAEKLIAWLHIPAAFCIAFGSLGRAGIAPYAAPYEWNFFHIASTYLTAANARELYLCARRFFQLDEGSLGDRPSTLPKYIILGEHMQMGAALAMTLGGVSLLNASIIALMQTEGEATELCRRQYAISFSLFLVGSAGNTVPESPALHAAHGTRLLVSFLNVVSSAAFCVAGVLSLPSLLPKGNLKVRDALEAYLSTAGSVVVVMSAVISYFHTVGLLSNAEEVYEANHVLAKYDPHPVKATEGSSGGFVKRIMDMLRSRGRTLAMSSPQYGSSSLESSGAGFTEIQRLRISESSSSLSNPSEYHADRQE